VAEKSPWIAIVDDDPAVLRALSRLLRSRAFLVTTYGSGQEFLAALPDGLPACLIVDFQMPEMNGFELRRLALSERPELPVILITGRPELRAQYSSIIERDRYFEKPFDGQRLLAAIRTALEGARPKGAA